VTDKLKRATFEELLAGEIPRSLINEKVDFTIDYTVKAESATARALRRWHMESEDHERE
jgi:hypothetical protein